MRYIGKRNKLRVKQRQEESLERQEKRDNRSDEDQLKLLDKKFGKGKGATKERTRLKKKIESKNNNPNKKTKRRRSRGKKK